MIRVSQRWSAWALAMCLGGTGACGDTGRPHDTVELDVAADVSDVSSDIDNPQDSDGSSDSLDPADPAVRRVDTGLLRGVIKGGAWAFLGIPYARPPVGELRFRRPVPPEPWGGVLETTTYGVACRQYYYDGVLIGDEDCLTLNVWTPLEAPAEPLPVMVYVHGGDNVFGFSGEYDFYDGRHLAGQGGVVLVTVNYRLGAFGFLSDPSFAADDADGATGNYGLHDQIAALTWVQNNIASFGGDPGRVMVFGQSAGASNTCAILASPLAKGLFHRALMQSLNCEPLTADIVTATWRQARNNLGCAGVDDVAACLRSADADAVASLPRETNGEAKYYVTVDGAVLVEDPLEAIRAGRHNPVPVILGTTEDEYSVIVDELVENRNPTVAEYEEVIAGIFGDELAKEIMELYPVERFPSPRRAVIEVISDYLMHCPTRRVARALRAGQTEPTWLYSFAHDYATGPLAEAGAAHGFETTFIFRTFAFEGIEPTPDELRLSDAMVAGWTGLARAGAPAVPDGSVPTAARPAAGPRRSGPEQASDTTFAWPLFDDTEMVTRLDWPLSVEAHRHTRRCDAWDRWL